MSELIGQSAEGMYKGRALREFYGTYQEGDLKAPIHFAVHPNRSRRIIVNVPGFNGELDGFADKYKILGNHMNASGLAAVVRTANHLERDWPADLNFNAVLKYTQERAWEICAEPDPEIMLMGASAGASAIAARAHLYPNVSTILLFAPSVNMELDQIKKGLARFKGRIVIVQGMDDDVVGSDAGAYFMQLATGTEDKELFEVPGCDHQFRGEKNGRILSEAPFYAFAKGEKPQFPDPTGGIKLYD